MEVSLSNLGLGSSNRDRVGFFDGPQPGSSDGTTIIVTIVAGRALQNVLLSNNLILNPPTTLYFYNNLFTYL
jgi:hypothetical protein